VTCWGDDRAGQRGGATTAEAGPPIAVAGTYGALRGGGGDGACALADGQTAGVVAGEAWCWGQVLTAHPPAHEIALDGATALALGATFGCALDGGGGLACVGDNGHLPFGNGGPGSCGDGACNAGETAASCAADCGAGPLAALGRRYAAVRAGWRAAFACGIRIDGGVECWGQSDRGQAAEPDPATYLVDPVVTPFAVPGLAGCTAVATGRAHACALCAGEISCWGDAREGQLGAPRAGKPVLTPRPIAAPLPDGDRWVDLVAGSTFTCARSVRGHAACWGSNRRGALGNGATSANRPVAVPVREAVPMSRAIGPVSR
jgi:hypothetical protein